mmetsp:Transcript_132929/g.384327  ORF Transcript_132929/g.384327 Transcript_132929/m.384327 type:complete len:119 (+) Transcript_132929:92-448(+)
MLAKVVLALLLVGVAADGTGMGQIDCHDASLHRTADDELRCRGVATEFSDRGIRVVADVAASAPRTAPIASAAAAGVGAAVLIAAVAFAWRRGGTPAAAMWRRANLDCRAAPGPDDQL